MQDLHGLCQACHDEQSKALGQRALLQTLSYLDDLSEGHTWSAVLRVSKPESPFTCAQWHASGGS